jgi:hypothetical protein
MAEISIIESESRPRMSFCETICGTDIHIVRGEYPVRPGLTIGHEAVGVIHEIGPGVTRYHVGQRVLVGAKTPPQSRAVRIPPQKSKQITKFRSKSKELS